MTQKFVSIFVIFVISIAYCHYIDYEKCEIKVPMSSGVVNSTKETVIYEADYDNWAWTINCPRGYCEISGRKNVILSLKKS